MIQKMFAALFAATALLSTAAARTPEVPAWIQKAESRTEQLAPGVRLTTFDRVRVFGKPQFISVLRADLTTPGLRLGLAECDGGNYETVSHFGRRLDALAAVNAGFFAMKGNPMGVRYLKIDGKVLNPDLGGDPERAYFVLDQTGRPAIVEPADFAPERCRSAVYGNRLLLKDGKVSPLGEDKARHPRTAAGLAGNTLLLVVIDGRARESAGVTFAELATLLKDLGCTDAVNLDGGGSSTMWTRHHGVVNHPSDNRKFDHAGERPVHNALYLISGR